MTTTYKDILAFVGYPTDILTLDFESYYDTEYSLAKISTIEYINAPEFELLGLGVGNGDFGPYFVEPHAVGRDLSEIDFENHTVIVQQAKFDITILQEKFGIVPKYIIDLKDLIKHYDARMSAHLKDVAKLFGLKPKGDTSQFKGLHWKDMTPEQRKDHAEYTITDVELETELFKILLLKLTNPEFELQLMRHTLDMWLHKRFGVDRELATELQGQMSTRMNEVVDLTGYTPKELRSQKFVRYINDIFDDGATMTPETCPMKAGKRGNIAAVAKNDDGCKWLQAHPNEKVRNLINARLAVKSWPLHIERVGNFVKQADANGGLLRVPLVYYGAHTGRWSGTEKINLQNLGGRGRAGVGVDPLIGQMRSLLKAPDGYTLGIGDSAQIEARVLAWLAGQDDLLEGFANGEDIYSEFATELFKVPIRKPRKTDPEPLSRFLEIKRGFGKDAILGCGYGMGTNKFYQRCLENPSLRPYFDSGTYNWRFIEKLIKTYRGTYKAIPAYWSKVERGFKQCIRFPHLEPEVGRVKFSCRGSTVHVRLPSGRVLYYRHCRIDNKGTIKYHHGALWGGSITENIDQAISRDLLGYWILECEKAGLPVVLHGHDEVVTLIKKTSITGHVQFGLEKLEQILCSLPDWAAGLPVAAEVKESERYCK